VRAQLALDIDHLLVKHVRFAIEARFEARRVEDWVDFTAPVVRAPLS
jgi:hypothetical protein